jgi:hypothetical protein
VSEELGMWARLTARLWLLVGVSIISGSSSMCMRSGTGRSESRVGFKLVASGLVVKNNAGDDEGELRLIVENSLSWIS